MKYKFIAKIPVLLFILSLFLPFSISAQGGDKLMFIRDAEIEFALQTYSRPILKAAGLPPENVSIIIVQDPSLNAFVAEGMNIFIHTGLISESEDPLVLTGVIAHEVGHIAGGHLIRKNEAYSQAILSTALSYVLGAASIAAGSSDAGAAIITGGQHIAHRNILSHSRIQEQSADQAALNFLERSELSAKGLLSLLEKLGSRETLFYNDIDPYTLTHPLSQDRISHIRNHLISSPTADIAVPESWKILQQRIVAKIKAFLDDPQKTLAAYPESDNSVKARYARSIAYHKKGELALAIKEIDALLEQSPEDPYFNELKGQILFENGKVDESITYYRKSSKIIPETPILKFQLAASLVASNDKRNLPEAISLLNEVVVKNSKDVGAWHLLGIAYGKNEQIGMSYLALAEEASIVGKKEEALDFIKRAEPLFEEKDPALLRARDIRKFLELKIEKK